MEPKVYSLKEVSEQLGCGLSTTYGIVNAGLLQARKLLNRTVVTREELQRFVEQLPPAELNKKPSAGKERPYPVRRGKARVRRAAA